MNEQERLAERFEANRAQLRAVAYRMLGSLSEADDAVQEWDLSQPGEHDSDQLKIRYGRPDGSTYQRLNTVGSITAGAASPRGTLSSR